MLIWSPADSPTPRDSKVAGQLVFATFFQRDLAYLEQSSRIFKYYYLSRNSLPRIVNLWRPTANVPVRDALRTGYENR